MNKIVLITVTIILLVSLPLSGCIVTASDRGGTETREYDYRDFTELDISSAFDFEIVQADVYAVSVTADSDLFEYIEVSREGNKLKIGFNTFPQLGWVWWGKANLKARIAMPSLTGLDVSGASEGTVSGFAAAEDIDIVISGASSLEATGMTVANLDLEISGASDIEGDFRADGDVTLEMSGASHADALVESTGDIELDLSGASRLELTGSAQDMQLKASGASDLDLEDFSVHNAEVEFSGASEGTIKLDGKMGVSLSGASHLYYIGEPVITEFDLSGGSELEKK